MDSLDRLAEKVPYHLRGAHVILNGCVAKIRYKNPFTKAKSDSRRWMFLLTDVSIGDLSYNHVWIDGKKSSHDIRNKIGEYITLIGKLKIYEHDQKMKWTLNVSYKLIY